jgi:hypothetical protein
MSFICSVISYVKHWFPCQVLYGSHYFCLLFHVREIVLSSNSEIRVCQVVRFFLFSLGAEIIFFSPDTEEIAGTLSLPILTKMRIFI